MGGRKGKDVRAKLGEIYERKGEGRKGEVERSNKRWTGGWDGCNIPYLITRTGAGAGSGGGDYYSISSGIQQACNIIHINNSPQGHNYTVQYVRECFMIEH